MSISLVLMLSILLMFSNWSAYLLVLSVGVLLSVSMLMSNWLFNLSSPLIMSSSMGSLMIFLSLSLSYLALVSTSAQKSKSYLLTMVILLISLVLAFLSSNIFSYYFFFEFSLIPTLILIVTWGYQPERLMSGVYMMMYTVGASLPLLIFLLILKNSLGSGYLSIIGFCAFPIGQMMLVSVVGAFLVKLPMYGLHLWLPKAHVEAPLAGSMILAGILLKLGGYGLWLFLVQLNLKFSNSIVLMFLLGALSMWGGLIASLMCLRQVDVKSFVAYSSVSHMSLVIAGIVFNSEWGISSAKITMFAHGFTSSCLFVLAFLSYEKVNSRSMNLMGGFLAVFPYLSLVWFLFCSMNMAAPPFLNLLGEMFVIPSLFLGGVMYVIIMGLMIFVSALYNMYLYTTINHGMVNYLVNSSNNVNPSGLLSCFFHVLPMALLFNMQIF